MADPPKTAIVVGGASGIGAACVAEARASGLDVLVWDVAGDPDIRCDVTDAASVDDAMVATVARMGVPTEVTITAGVGHGALLLDTTVEDWDRVIAVNTRGPLLVMRAAARAMIDAGVPGAGAHPARPPARVGAGPRALRPAGSPGSNTATSSVSAHLVDRAMGPYCASKAALSMLVRVAACEWATHGIRVNGVGPGVTETPMLGRAPVDSGWLAAVAGRTPLGRLGRADDVARAVRALHSVDWVTGQILDCDGGLALHSPIDSFGEHQRSG